MVDAVLGPLRYDDAECGFVTEERPISFLGGHRCRFVLQFEGQGPVPADVRAAVLNVLAAGPEVLTRAEADALNYRADMLALDGRPAAPLKKPGELWAHVRFGDTLYVSQRADGDSEDGVYVSLECNCDWEVEHGLQLVLRDGLRVSKLGPFNGHVTNADAAADPRLVGVVYRRLGR